MKEFNRYLNGGIAYLKLFPGSKAKQLDHCTIHSLEEHKYDAAVIHIWINDLLKDRANIKVMKLLNILSI